MIIWYILDGKTVRPGTAEEWMEQRESETYVLKHTTIGQALISTVFLPHAEIKDSQITKKYPPMPFETMIFDDAEERGYAIRYATWELAMEGHQEAIDRLSVNQN